ncbi:MAG: fimbrillin family protein [Bacteroides sp.]|nr:fimbrillin family protein [Bacteroides sp.]
MTKKHIYTLLYFVLPLLAGCTDDYLYDGDGNTVSSENVSFSAVVTAAGDRQTRAAYVPYEPLELHNDGDDFPIYLHTYEHPLDEETADVEPATRGVQVNSAKDLFDIHKSFDVRGDMESDGSSYITMQDTKLVSTGGYNIWTTEHPQRWPGNDRIAFNAVAPHGHLSKLQNAVYAKNEIRFSYTALKGNGTNDAEAQTDLLMATATMNRRETEPTNYRVPLQFNHALSAIKFAVRDVIAGKIVSIAIKGINGSGDCVFTADSDSKNGKFEWSNQSNIQTYTQVFNHEISTGNYDPTDESQDKLLTDAMPEKTFMVIPQEIPEDAEVEIVVERYNVAPLPSTITVRGKIKANNVQEWKPGYEYVYTVSTSKDNWVYVFDAEGNDAGGIDNIYVYSPSDERFDGPQNTAYFNVRSYRYRANEQNYIEALPWSASHDGSYSYWIQGSSETAYPSGNAQLKWVDAKDWITDKFATPLSGKGIASKTAKEKHDLDFLAHYITTDWVGDETMQKYAPYSGYTKENPYDLSKFGGARSRTTANCYVVDRGGWYMFPLVYGNAIKNGATNSSAYTCQNTSTATNLNLLKTLTDYNDSPITQPTISTNNNARAELVWQDAYGLVDQIELVTIGGEKMIRFYVEPNNIQQGNAIIALTAGNSVEGASTIIWSWHIWATEHWIDKDTRLPHVYDTSNTTFNTYKASAAKNENGAIIGLRECGDVAVTYNQKGRSFMMSAYNLGWCDPKKVVYLKRKSDMAFVQYMPDGTTKTGLTDNLPIIQQGETIDYKYANNTYYQWGRKDPIRGYFNHEHETKRVFGPRSPKIIQNRTINIGEGIKNPEVFYCSTDAAGSAFEDWLTTNFKSNLWNNHGTSSLTSYDDDSDHADMWSHLKTVYDPSPAGYMVPNAGVWHVVQKAFSTQRTNDQGNVVTSGGSQRDKWAGGNWNVTAFANKINGVRIDDYNYKVWGNGVANNANALFFSSTGNRWWTSGWNPGSYTGGAGGNFGRNVSYAWSNRSYTGHNAYGMALGLDTDNNDGTEELRYYVGGQFIGRRAMGRPVRAIREP